jgi:hypothetical protein
MRVGGQRHAPAALPPGKWPGTHSIRGWVGLRAGLDGCGKSKMDAEWASEPVCTFWRREAAVSSAGIRTADNEARSQVAGLSRPSRLHIMQTIVTEEAPVTGLQAKRRNRSYLRCFRMLSLQCYNAASAGKYLPTVGKIMMSLSSELCSPIRLFCFQL